MTKDPSYSYIGIFLLLVSASMFASFIFRTLPGDESFTLTVFAVVSIVVRIWVTGQVRRYARRIHRSAGMWGFFAFCFPGFTTLILGCKDPL